MVQISGQGKIDLSFIASLKCNLKCPHCQYDASPNQKEWMDYDRLRDFMKTAIGHWEVFNSFGFYGGEITTNIKQWSKYIRLINLIQKEYVYGPRRYQKNKKPVWMITNGSWSTSDATFHQMVNFAYQNELQVYISTTPYHKPHQDIRRLEVLVKYADNFHFKADDTKKRLLPMGRNYTPDWYCTRRCEREEATERLAIMPNLDVIYQKCDGIYPVVANVSPPSVTWTGMMFTMHNRIPTICPVLRGEQDIGDPSWQEILEESPPEGDPYPVQKQEPERSRYLSV